MRHLTATILSTAALFSSAPAQETEDTFTNACAVAAEKELATGYTGVQGADPDWYFLYKELRHLGLGEFWTSDYSTTASNVDPAPIIIDYHEQLKALGVELLLVPVPAKASVYPEKFNPAGQPVSLSPFLKKLNEAGVQVLDLEQAFKSELEKNPDNLLYCKTDSHYTPRTTQLIAKLIHEKYKDTEWAKAIASETKFSTTKPKPLTLKGDLTPDKTETLQVVQVTDAAGNQVEANNETSPILLLGDSHTKVYSTGGELHTNASGLPDHLQAAFRAPIYLMANNASGVYTARVNLMRVAHKNKEFWTGKKLVIWHFTARDLTQEPKWKKLPAKP